jgi:hypothetical protein
MSGSLQINEPGRRTRARRLAFNPPVVCPAAMPLFETPEGAGVRCAVDRNTLTALRDPQSLDTFCFGNYAMCTSWQMEKEWVAEGHHRHVTEQSNEGDREKRRKEWEELGVQVEVVDQVEVTRFEEPD